MGKDKPGYGANAWETPYVTPEDDTAAKAAQYAATSSILGGNASKTAGTYANGNVTPYTYTTSNKTSDMPSKESPSFFGGLYDSITSGTKNLFSSGPGKPAASQLADINSLNLPWDKAADIQYTMGNLVGSKEWDEYSPEKRDEILGDLTNWDTDAYKGKNYGGDGIEPSFWNDTIGGAKGFADLAGGLGSLASMYYGYESNKRADKIADAQMAEVKRQKQRDVDFANSVNKSGLGAYSAGVK